MLEKPAVLGGDEGVFGVLGNRLAWHLVAALFENPGHWLAGCVSDRGDAGHPAVSEVGEVGLHRLVGACEGGAPQAHDGGKAERNGQRSREKGDEQASKGFQCGHPRYLK